MSKRVDTRAFITAATEIEPDYTKYLEKVLPFINDSVAELTTLRAAVDELVDELVSWVDGCMSCNNGLTTVTHGDVDWDEACCFCKAGRDLIAKHRPATPEGIDE